MPCRVFKSELAFTGVLLIDCQSFKADLDQVANIQERLIFAKTFMKKAIFTIAVLCYFAAASGVIINSHYCMKKLVSVELFGSQQDVCSKCGMDTHEFSGCCHDVVKVVKLEQDKNRFSTPNYEIPALEQVIVAPSEFLITPFLNNKTELFIQHHTPPLLSEQDTYLQLGVFRI